MDLEFTQSLFSLREWYLVIFVSFESVAFSYIRFACEALSILVIAVYQPEKSEHPTPLPPLKRLSVQRL